MTHIYVFMVILILSNYVLVYDVKSKESKSNENNARITNKTIHQNQTLCNRSRLKYDRNRNQRISKLLGGAKVNDAKTMQVL